MKSLYNTIIESIIKELKKEKCKIKCTGIFAKYPKFNNKSKKKKINIIVFSDLVQRIEQEFIDFENRLSIIYHIVMYYPTINNYHKYLKVEKDHFKKGTVISLYKQKKEYIQKTKEEIRIFIKNLKCKNIEKINYLLNFNYPYKQLLFKKPFQRKNKYDNIEKRIITGNFKDKDLYYINY